MKTSLAILILFFVALQNSMPPQKIRNALKQKFPSAVNIKWYRLYNGITTDWEASFNLREKKATARFTSEARWHQSTLEITAKELNEAVQQSVKEDYPKCQILSAIMTENPGMTWYAVKIKCGDKIIEEDYDFRGMSYPPRIT